MSCVIDHVLYLYLGFEGCMIVEISDWRDSKSAANLDTPEKRRVVLTPSPESTWADICSISQKRSLSWTDTDALEFEARMLVCSS